MVVITSRGAESRPLSEERLSQHIAFIHNLEREPTLITDASYFKINEFAYRLFPVLTRLSGRLASEILMDGQACRSLYSAALGAIDPTCVLPLEIALMRILEIELPGNMNLVVITAEGNQLVARLSGGRELKCGDSHEMADLLVAEGIHASDVRVPDWRAGDISPAKGQKISIFGIMGRSELRRK